MGEEKRVVGMAAALHTRASLSFHSSVVMVAQLHLSGNFIGDAGISAVLGAFAANDTLACVCDGATQRCGLQVHVRVMPNCLCTARAWQILW